MTENRMVRASRTGTVTKVGPLVEAPEWAMRIANDIASRHIDVKADEPAWDRWAELGKDIAEALYSVATPLNGGRRIAREEET